MARFDDYHRTIIGYHGTGLSAALRIVNRIEPFRSSERDDDWLGRGVYFWEYAPKQALTWARERQKKHQRKRTKTPEDERRATEPLGVIACMIRLGFCPDLTEPENVEYLKSIFEEYGENMELAGEPLPRNYQHVRKLDRAVFEYAYKVIEDSEPHQRVDTSRGIYVPKDGTKRIWEGSWLSRGTHIQICVRNTSSILGPGSIIRPAWERPMSVKRYKLALPSSSQRIRKAMQSLKAMPKARRIDLMVKAGVMTPAQADRAKRKLAEQVG